MNKTSLVINYVVGFVTVMAATYVIFAFVLCFTELSLDYLSIASWPPWARLMYCTWIIAVMVKTMPIKGRSEW